MRAINVAGQSIPQTSQAMLVPSGKLLFLAGHVASGEDGIVGTDLAAQLEQVFRNLQATLNEAGATFENVARLTIYVRDYEPSMISTIREVRGRYVNLECPPASTLLGVSALYVPEILVEIEGIAVIPA